MKKSHERKGCFSRNRACTRRVFFVVALSMAGNGWCAKSSLINADGSSLHVENRQAPGSIDNRHPFDKNINATTAALDTVGGQSEIASGVNPKRGDVSRTNDRTFPDGSASKLTKNSPAISNASVPISTTNDTMPSPTSATQISSADSANAIAEANSVGTDRFLNTANVSTVTTATDGSIPKSSEPTVSATAASNATGTPLSLTNPSNSTVASGSAQPNPKTTTEKADPKELGDILDLRPAVKLKMSLLPWIFALIVILAAIGLRFLLKRKRRRTVKKAAPPKPIDPYAEVLQALKETLGQIDVADPKPFAFSLNEAVRLYLSRIFRLPAPECTTQELLEQLPKCVELTDALRTDITQFLQRCDLVKFTQMPFDNAFLTQLHQQAESVVAVSHELTKPKSTPIKSENKKDSSK